MENVKEVKNVNRFVARGRIISRGMDNMGRPSITLVIRGRETDYIRVTLTKPLENDIQLHNNVKVEGHIRSFRYFNQIRNKNVSVQYFVADKITKEIPYLTQELGIPAKHFKMGEFNAIIQ